MAKFTISVEEDRYTVGLYRGCIKAVDFHLVFYTGGHAMADDAESAANELCRILGLEVANDNAKRDG